MNGDGKLDLVATGTSFLGVLLGDGAGHFPNLTFFSAPTALELRLADLNGDGRTDVALAMGRAGAGGAEVLLNACGRASTDLALTVSDSPDPVQEGGALTYTATVTNNGPLAATNVSFTATVPTTATVNLVTPATGTCATPNAGVISCNLGTLQSGAAASVTVQVTVGNGGTLTTTAGVGSDQADPTPTNNSVTITTTVTAVGRALLVTNTNDSGAGSLRQAILDSNADSGDVDRISFNILGAGLHTIAPSTALPAMTQPAIIDGTTQPGFAGTPIIELSGANIATTVAGLAVNSPSGGAIKGLVVNRFRGAGITVSGPGITISGNYVGTTTSGTAAAGNFYGISLLDSSNNVIGGATAGTGNLISGNTSVGIVVTKSGGSGSNNNQIVGNLIGTDVTGTLPVPNATGVDIFDSSNNRIGGTTAPERNVVSGNTQNGVTIEGNATGTLVQGNYVGTTAGGDQILANGGAGISIASPGVTIGGTTSGAGNAISGNNGGGIVVDTASSNALVQGNTIGPNAALTAVLGNQSNGVFIRSSISGTTIGGTAAGAGNVIAGSSSPTSASAARTHDSGQHDQHQSGRNGELVTRERRNQPGVNGIEYTDRWQRHWRAQRDHRDDRELHGKRGVRRRHEQLDRGELHGVNAAGAASVGNGGAGVGFDAAAQSNFVGDFTTGTGNVIAGSFFNGVSVSGINNSVLSNRIGTNAAGTVAIPNGTGGAFGGVIVNAGARGTLVGFINNAGNLIWATTPTASSWTATDAGSREHDRQ